MDNLINKITENIIHIILSKLKKDKTKKYIENDIIDPIMEIIYRKLKPYVLLFIIFIMSILALVFSVITIILS